LEVTTERLEDCQVAITIAFDAKEINKVMRSKARKISRHQQIPGFRPGRAPYPVVERTVGRTLLLKEAVDELTPQAVKDALEENDLDIYDEDTIESSLVEEDPPVIRFTFQTPPRVELGDYRGIRIEQEEVSVEQEQVDTVLQGIQEQSGTWATSPGPAEFGDLTTIDIRGDLLDGTVLVDNRDVQGVLVESEEEDPLKASEELVGMMVNQTKEYTITFPDDYEPEHLAGRTALYRATMLDIKKRELPELTDEWAKEVSHFESIAELREDVENKLLASEEHNAREKLVHDYLRAVEEISTVELPPKMVDKHIDREVSDISFDVIRQGGTLEGYLEQEGLADEDALRAQLRPQAEKELREDSILFAIAREDNIQVSDEEVEAEIEASVQKFGDRADEARKIFSARKEDIYARLLSEKTKEHVAALARGEIPEETPEPEHEPTTNETEAAPVETDDGETIAHEEEEDQ